MQHNVFYAKQGVFVKDHIRIFSEITSWEARIGRYSSWKGFFFPENDIFLRLQIDWGTVPVVRFSVLWREHLPFPKFENWTFSSGEMCTLVKEILLLALEQICFNSSKVADWILELFSVV